MRKYLPLTLAVAALFAGQTARGEDADKSRTGARLYVSSAGAGATGDIVRGGVPFPKTMNVTDLSRYSVWRPRSADGKTGDWVPVQWAVTSRFDGTPSDTTKPVRWAIAQFPGFDGPYELRTDAPADVKAPAAIATQSDTRIDVDTGALRFSVNRAGKFAPMQGLKVRTKDASGQTIEKDALADGAALDVIMTLADRADDGSVVDHTYRLSDTQIVDAAVEENGPYRSVVRIHGLFQDKDGKPLLQGYLAYTIRISADRGSDQLRVFFTLENNGVYGPPADQSRVTVKPNWIRIRELDLIVPTRLGANNQKLRGSTADGTWEFANGAAGDDFRLLQQHTVVDKKDERRNFKYSVRTATGWNTQKALYGSEMSKGGRSDGGLSVDDGSIALTADVKDFWQNYPKAMTFDDGALKVELWPREPGEKWPEDLPARWGDAYEFEGGRHKTYEVMLSFSGSGSGTGAANDVAAREKRFQHPAAMSVDPAWIQACNATMGAFAAPAAIGPTLSLSEAQQHHARMQIGQVDVNYCDAQGSGGEIAPASLVTQRETRGNALVSSSYDLDCYGYASFGDLPHDLGFSSGHHDWVKGLFLNWLRFGKREFLDIGIEMMRHRYDYDQYHCVDRLDPNWKWYNGFQRFELGFHGARLADFEPHGEGTGVPQNTWLEGCLLGYAITGDPRAMETARENADAFVNYFTVSGALDKTVVRGSLDYFGQLSAMSVGVDQLMAFYEFTGERTYYDTAMRVFENGLLKAEEYYGNRGFFNTVGNQQQIWPVVRLIHPLIAVHRMSDDPRALAMLMRVMTFLSEQGYEGTGMVDEQGLYMPLQLPYQWDMEDGKRVAKKWFIPYNFFTCDGFAYCYMATGGEAELFLDWARATYRDGVTFYQAPIHQAIPPGFYSDVSYAPRQYPSSETKNGAWMMSGGQYYLQLEQSLAGKKEALRADKIRFEDWFTVRRRSVEQRASRRPIGWFMSQSVFAGLYGATPVTSTAIASVAAPAPQAAPAPVTPAAQFLPPPPPPAPLGRETPAIETKPAAPAATPAPAPAAQPAPVTSREKPAVITVDDRDGVAVFSGDWQTVQASDANNGSMRTVAHAGRNSTATYTITVPRQGRYYVMITWPKLANAAKHVPVDVGHGGNWDAFDIDQTRVCPPSGFILTEVEGGPSSPVIVRFKADGGDGVVVADAVRLVPIPAGR